ncbi:NHL repeat-containing protein [bacterium]|nr:NHL repeat-containing protein [bacterium]
MNKRCTNPNWLCTILSKVKAGDLDFSFWRVFVFVFSIAGLLQWAHAQESFTLLIDRKSGLLRDARAMSVAPDGTIYIADTGHNRIVQVGADGTLLGEIGDLGKEHGQFQWPIDVAAQQGTSIWVSDFGNRRIERFTRRFTWQGTIKIPSIDGDFTGQPGALAMTAMGDLFVVDQDGQRLLKFNPLGILQAEYGAQKGIRWVSQIDNLAANTEFGIFWADREANLVRRMDLFGNGLGDLGRGQLSSPERVAFSERTLWVSDSTGILRADVEQGEFIRIFETQTLQENGIRQLSDFACVKNTYLYILDGYQGQLWRVSLLSK